MAFAGAPEFAAIVLRRLLASKHHVDMVYTQPDRPAGRGRRLMPSAVRATAEAAGIAVRTPTSLKGEATTLAEFDWLVVAAYGLLLPPKILAAPTHHCLNVHASLLPRWRGAAPIERAIMAGDAETGVSIMRMDAGLDTGPVYHRRTLPLDTQATGGTASAALAELGAQALLETLDELPELAPTPQDHHAATYAKKIEDADAAIDWHQSATTIDRQVRALHGRMAAYTQVGDARLRILQSRPLQEAASAPPGTLAHHGKRWRVACGEGMLELETVQLNRGKGTPQPIQNIANGYRELLFDGSRLG